jgi:DNA-binding transcriptional regulator YiaG
MLKYKSDAMEAIYEDALANFEVGAITREELTEYESACIVSKTTSILASKSSGSPSWAIKPSRAYASKTN